MAFVPEDVAVRRRLGTLIGQYRIAKGLSQGALADEIGLKQSFMSYLERGEFWPKLPQLRDIERVLDLTPGFLLVRAGVVDPTLIDREAVEQLAGRAAPES